MKQVIILIFLSSLFNLIGCTDPYLREYEITERIYNNEDLGKVKDRLVEYDAILVADSPVELLEKSDDALSAILLTRIRLYSISKLEGDAHGSDDYYKKIVEIEDIKRSRDPNVKKTPREDLDDFVRQIAEAKNPPAWVQEIGESK